MMDIDKFNVLTELVREAKNEDTRTFQAMEAANAAWKAANKVLSERLDVLNGYVQQNISEATGVTKK